MVKLMSSQLLDPLTYMECLIWSKDSSKLASIRDRE